MLDSAFYVFSIYVQALNYGHEICLMTNRVRSRLQAAELSFLRRVLGSALEIEWGTWTTRGTKKEVVEMVHLHFEVFQECPTGRRLYETH